MADEQVAFDDEEGADTMQTAKPRGLSIMTVWESSAYLPGWVSHYIASRTLLFLTWIMAITTVSGLQYRCELPDDTAKPMVEMTSKFVRIPAIDPRYKY